MMAAASLPAGSDAASLHILVVEDDVDSREMLCELLSLLGHQASSAGSAEEAEGVLKQEGIDVLLTDISLPGRSGVELARDARTRHPSLGIIFASGYSGISDVDFPFHSLLKPYDLNQLQDALHQAAAARS